MSVNECRRGSPAPSYRTEDISASPPPPFEQDVSPPIYQDQLAAATVIQTPTLRIAREEQPSASPQVTTLLIEHTSYNSIQTDLRGELESNTQPHKCKLSVFQRMFVICGCVGTLLTLGFLIEYYAYRRSTAHWAATEYTAWSQQ